ncbi:MAG: tetratricopeptide repeat protein [Lentisphaerales bacterium]|nr:MAG: tetratricopeptide repeat protein [Lentisphaerales bacterium]
MNCNRNRPRPSSSNMIRFSLNLAVVLFMLPVLCPAERPSPDAALRTGRAALEDGFYDIAVKNFEAYLGTVKKRSPEAEAATILLVQSLYGQQKYDIMLRQLGSSKEPEFVFWRAMANYELKKYERVLSDLGRIGDDCSDTNCLVRAERLRSKCFLAVGQTNEAMATFERIEADFPDSPEAAGNLLDWARALMATGQPLKARDVLTALTDKAPATPAGQEGRCILGRLLAADGKTPVAAELLSELAGDVNAVPEFRADACFSLAEIRIADGVFGSATNLLSTGISLARDPALKNRGMIRLGGLLLKLGLLDEGAKMLKASISSDPGADISGSLQLAIADAHLDGGNFERAAIEYQFYLDTFSDREGNARALSGRGWALSSLAEPRFAEAADLFQKAYELSEDPATKAEHLLKVADSFFNNSQFTLATETYGRLAREFPDSPLVPQALFQIAESRARSGQLTEAEDLFRDLLVAYPNAPFSTRALLRIAELREDEGHHLAALAEYERVMGVASNTALYVSALHAHGLICYRMLRFETALEDFERVVALSPDSRFAEQAFYMRGWCHQMMGREQEALATCKQFVERFPNSTWTPEVILWIGEYLFTHGENAAAEEVFLSLAQKFDDHPLAATALLRAGATASRQKEYLRSTEHLVELIKKYPGTSKVAQARYSQGDALTELGKFASAILIFEELINKYPDSYLIDSAWGRKGDCQFALGSDDTNRYVDAMTSYNMVINSEAASADLQLQAQYKIGRCLQKLKRHDEAFDHYYTKVVLAYFENASNGSIFTPASEVWFTRAAFDAVDYLEGQKRWREAVRLLRRVVDAGVPASDEATERIRKIRLKHLILFY